VEAKREDRRGAPIDQLVSFSEFALALAGFAAISLVLGRREGDLPSGSAYVVQFMVVNALGPAILALLAAVLGELEIPHDVLFRLCSGLYLLVAAFFGVVSIRQERVLRKGGELALPTRLSNGLWVASLLAHLVQLSNLVGYPAGPSVGVFLLGLWILLTMAAIQFVALLFVSLR
jgi:hypothetical protein